MAAIGTGRNKRWKSRPDCDPKPADCCVLPSRAQQPFNPPIRIQLPDGTNGIEVNSGGNPASFVTVTLTNVPSGYAVTNGKYLAWCVEAAGILVPREFDPQAIYKPLLFGSCDLGALQAAGLPTADWDKVNYIINNKAMWANLGYNVSEIQAAIWRFIGFDAAEEANILSGNYGFGFPAGSAANVQAIAAKAVQFGTGFVPGAGQVTAVILQTPGFLQNEVADADKGKPGQLLFIEVVCIKKDHSDDDDDDGGKYDDDDDGDKYDDDDGGDKYDDDDGGYHDDDDDNGGSKGEDCGSGSWWSWWK